MKQNVQCEDCQFANWDMKLFADDANGSYGINNFYSEQFDMYCQKHNKFLLEQEVYTTDCSDGTYGENNYHDVCQEYYRLRNKYVELLRQFRRELDDREYDDNWTFIDRGSREEFELWDAWLKEKDIELYNQFHNETE